MSKPKQTLPATFILECPFGEVTIAATERLAVRYRLNGVTAIGPKHAELLAKINKVFPGSRVVGIKSIGSKGGLSNAI